VTVGDQICIPYNNKYYYLEVREVKPADAACIIETDCNVDFEAPVGYKEPEWKPANGSNSALESKGGGGLGGMQLPRALSAKGGYVAENKEGEDAKPKFFTGSGQRLDGKPSRNSTPTADVTAVEPPSPSQPQQQSVPQPLGGRTVGGQTVGGGSGSRPTSAAGLAAEARRPMAALGGKYSSKKTFSSFGGQGNTLK